MSYGKHTRNPGYQAGNYWVECERCGFDYRRSDIAVEWTGAIVCKKYCWEPRNIQDLVQGVGDGVFRRIR